MDFFEMPRNILSEKDRIEKLQDKQQEYRLVWSTRKINGHTMFSYNLNTGEIKVAQIQRCDMFVLGKGKASNDKIQIEKDCIYIQALNKRNALKKINKLFNDGTDRSNQADDSRKGSK